MRMIFENITREKINFFAACLMVFSLPFYRWLSIYFIAFWIITWLVEANFINKFRANSKSLIMLILPVVYYLLHIISMLYTENKEVGWFDLQVKLSFIVFPLIFLTVNNFYKSKFRFLLKIFIAANLLTSLICILRALYFSLTIKEGILVFDADVIHAGYSFWETIKVGGTYFMYSRLSAFLHPGYYSLYMTFVLASLLFVFLEHSQGIKQKAFIIFLSIYFTIFTFMLFSRVGLVNIAIVYGAFFLYKAIKEKKIKYKLIHAFLLGIFSTLIIVAIVSNNRFKIAINEIKKFNLNTLNVTDNRNDRLSIWYSSVKIINKNILLGVGTGDVMDNLKEEYQKYKMIDAYNNKLNVHNQFIESFMGTGVMGFISLLAVFIAGIIKSIRKRNILFLVFILNAFVFCFIESMFNTQVGVVFFVFFYCLFCVNLHRKPAL